MDALQAQAMPFTEDASYPFWSPDSRSIGFFAQGKLNRIAASGGPAQPLCDVITAPADRGIVTTSSCSHRRSGVDPAGRGGWWRAR